MDSKKINSVLKNVLENIEPPREDLKLIKSSLKDFLVNVKKRISGLKINASVFVGGSFAKGTIMKKDSYDLDIFVRFDKSYSDEEISKLMEKILEKFKNVENIHGSRDYFKINITPNFFIEVVPVTKVRHSAEARNITDLSYFHVNYIKKKLDAKMLNEVLLAKAFCHAQGCYGAESYIQGFSGYSLELLICHYKSFLKFVKGISVLDKRKIIDLEKDYSGEHDVLMNMNSSKINSDLILIDPTFKERNVVAALSSETLEDFQKSCKKLLKNPSEKMFEKEKLDFEKVEKDVVKKNLDFVILKLKTGKQEGDIAGSKLLKFYKHLCEELKRFYVLKKIGFEYSGGKEARCFFVVKNREDILFDGPFLKDKKNVAKFKKEHKKTFVKKNRIYANEKFDVKIKDFLKDWKNKNCERIREMSICEIGF